MADELDPVLDQALEVRLRDVLRVEADAVPFSLRVADLEGARQARANARTRRWIPASLLAAAAAVVILVAGFGALRNAATPPAGSASPDPQAAELQTYEQLAADSAMIGGQVLAQGENLTGELDPASRETVIGSLGAVGYVDFVYDCRGKGSLWIGVQQAGTDASGGSSICGDHSLTVTADVGAGGDVVVRTDPGVVWRAVAVGTTGPQASGLLPSYDALTGVATSTHEIARDEEVIDGSIRAAVQVLALGTFTNLEVAAGCTGGGEVTITTSGTSDDASPKAAFTCDGTASQRAITLLDDVARRAADAGLMVQAAPGTAWRVIVYARMPAPTAPTAPVSGFPTTLQGGYAGTLSPDETTSIDMVPLPAGSTVRVGFGCVGDASTLVAVTLDEVTAEMACLDSNTWLFVPAGTSPSPVQVKADGPVDIALEVRSFTQEQAGAKVVIPSASLSNADSSPMPGYTACTTSFAIPGGDSADEGCGPSWREIPVARGVNTVAGATLELSGGPDWTLTGAALDYVPTVSVSGSQVAVAPVKLPDASGRGAGGGLVVDALPEGDWILRATVSGTLANGTTFTAQQLFRVIVGGV